MQTSYNSSGMCLLICDLNDTNEVASLIVCRGRELSGNAPEIYLFSPPYYDTILIYRNFLKYGRKSQRNHEAYTTWAIHAKLLRINLILI